MIDKKRQTEAVARLIERCQDEAFWGKVTVAFSAGQIKMVTKEETLPMEKLEEQFSENIAIQVDDGQ